MIFTLQNKFLRVSVDEQGRLIELVNLKTARNHVGNGPFFRIIFQQGRLQEQELFPEKCRVERTGENSLLLEYRAGNFHVAVTATLEADEIRFDAKLANRDPEAILREFQFPLLAGLELSSEDGLIDSALGGRRIRNFSAFLDTQSTAYVGQDNKAIESWVLYPGIASFNYFLLTGHGGVLYMGSHDPDFRNTLHLYRKHDGKVDAAMVKYPFLNPGENTSIPGYVLAPCAGSWRDGADHYRRWMNSWRNVGTKPAALLESNGWQRLIFRHQYGKILFRYSDMPEILKIGMTCGIDTLFLFGWHLGGHDSEYPEYRFDDSQGGHDELRRRIAAFQAAGGKVILYFNGQLIDTATEFYQRTGKKISAKLPSGREHMEFYPFGGDGTALRQFGNKAFVTACPGCHEWTETLIHLADIAIDLGCAGVFFDQLGYLSYPCCDPSHGHRTPFMNVFKAKAEMVRRIAAHVKARRPEMMIGIEWINDVTSQYVDFVHNITGGTGPNDFHELLRYTAPDIVTTDREIRDDTDVERRVNHAIRLGFRSDVEIYRCRATIAETPRYQHYLTTANQFRDRHRNLILNGTFRDTEGIECDNAHVEYSVYHAQRRRAIVATAHEVQQHVRFPIPSGWRFLGSDALNGATAEKNGNAVTATFPIDSLLLLEFIQE